jgi:flagellar basal body rod protein FlgC
LDKVFLRDRAFHFHDTLHDQKMSLSSVFSISLSGMNAAALRESTAGSNVANALTTGYRRASVVQTALPGGGVAASVKRGVGSGADLVEDVVSQMGAVYSFKANLLSLKVADRMAGIILNLRA